MPKINLSTKRLQIDKANTAVVVAVSVAAFVTIFSLIASHALLSQRAYHSRVIEKKEQAKSQLEQNVQAVNSLAASYQTFVETPVNILGGSSRGNGSRDGDNARLVLDALPSQYDFPALTSSIEKILTENNFKIGGISGKDEELTYVTDSAGSDPVEIPYSLSIESDYRGVQNLLGIFERSIRPFEARTISMSGTDSSLQISMDGVTYYQPAKVIEIKKTEVK